MVRPKVDSVDAHHLRAWRTRSMDVILGRERDPIEHHPLCRACGNHYITAVADAHFPVAAGATNNKSAFHGQPLTVLQRRRGQRPQGRLWVLGTSLNTTSQEVQA